MTTKYEAFLRVHVSGLESRERANLTNEALTDQLNDLFELPEWTGDLVVGAEIVPYDEESGNPLVLVDQTVLRVQITSVLDSIFTSWLALQGAEADADFAAYAAEQLTGDGGLVTELMEKAADAAK